MQAAAAEVGRRDDLVVLLAGAGPCEPAQAAPASRHPAAVLAVVRVAARGEGALSGPALAARGEVVDVDDAAARIDRDDAAVGGGAETHVERPAQRGDGRAAAVDDEIEVACGDPAAPSGDTAQLGHLEALAGSSRGGAVLALRLLLR